MPLVEQIVEVFGGSGGPTKDGIPGYADAEAPNKLQLTGTNGQQIFLRNSDVTGLLYVILDKSKLIDGVDPVSAFYNKNGYTRVWLFNPANPPGKQGDPIVIGQDAWFEASHFRPASVPPPVDPEEPEEPTEPPQAGDLEVTNVRLDITLNPLGIRLFLRVKNPE